MEKNTIIVNKKSGTNIKVFEVTGDVIVPDIKPDIISIVNTNGIPYIYKEDISTGKLRIDGNIDSYVVYLADNGETCAIGANLNFIENIESEFFTENCFAKNKIILEKIEAKILNERKVSIIATIKVKTEIFEKEEISVITYFEGIENAELLKENLSLKSVVGMNKVKTSVKEDCKPEEGYQITEILSTNVNIVNSENKISFNKVLAKAEAEIKVLFLSADGRIGVINTKSPIMSFIEIDKITDKNVCDISYNIRNMLFKVNNQNTQTTISYQIEFEVFCEAYEIKGVDIIQDMYGLKDNLKFNSKTVELEINKNLEKEKVNLNERILIEDILNIYDVKCSASIINSNKIGNIYSNECEANLEFYYEADNRNGLNVKKVNFPFVVKSESEKEFEFEFSKKQFTVSNENVDCELEISYNFENENLKIVNIIDDVQIEKIEPEKEYKMCMYFVKPGDTLWKIAKKFKVSLESIVKVNNIENPDKINIGDRLYIFE